MGSPEEVVARQVDYRHPLPVRVWHWVNATAVVVLLLTGLLIFDIPCRPPDVTFPNSNSGLEIRTT